MNALRRTAAGLVVLAVCVVTFAAYDAYDDVRLQAAVQGLLSFCAR